MNKEQSEMTGQSEGFYAAIGQISDKVMKDPASGDDEKPKPKRKRKSPAVPWKKPKDMPKRPLSAYNLFFKDEREKLLNRGKMGADDDAADAGKKKPSGIGFANLAKTIAAKWNDLAPELRAPYEEIAGKEKAKYDESVAKWRIVQKEKQAKEKAMKKEAEEQSAAKAAEAGLFSPSGSAEGYSRDSDAYPSQWFQSGMEHGESEAGIPPFVDTIHDDSTRSYASSSLSPDSPRRRMRPSPPMHSGTSSLSTSSPATDPSAYYAHPYYAYHDPQGRSRHGYSGRRFDPYAGAAPMHMGNQMMRDSRTGRATSIPQMRGPHLASEMERIQSEVAELRRARSAYYHEGEAGSYPSYSAGQQSIRSAPAATSSGLLQVHPRSASLPASLAGAHGGPSIPATGTDLEAEDPAYRESKRSRRSRRSPSGDEAVFEASLRSLSENLDDDAISFLTNVRFE